MLLRLIKGNGSDNPEVCINRSITEQAEPETFPPHETEPVGEAAGLTEAFLAAREREIEGKATMLGLPPCPGILCDADTLAKLNGRSTIGEEIGSIACL